MTITVSANPRAQSTKSDHTSNPIPGSWNTHTGFNSPLYPRSSEKGDKRLLNQQATVDTWIDGGCPASKLVLGLGMYGRTFKMKPKKNGDNKAYSPSKGPGLAGNFTATAGFLSYRSEERRVGKEC